MREEKRLIRIEEVIARCGIKKTNIYQKMKEGNFPISVRLGPASVAWRSDEVNKWIESRPRNQ